MQRVPVDVDAHVAGADVHLEDVHLMVAFPLRAGKAHLLYDVGLPLPFDPIRHGHHVDGVNDEVELHGFVHCSYHARYYNTNIYRTVKLLPRQQSKLLFRNVFCKLEPVRPDLHDDPRAQQGI